MNIMGNLLDKIQRAYNRLCVGGVRVYNYGTNNDIIIAKPFHCGKFEIYFCGNNNSLEIGEKCNFKRYNRIYIGGDNNIIKIGKGTDFDQNVIITVAEGSSLIIGDDCIFANGVRVRTSDQHIIFSSDGKRINPPQNVFIGNHCWLGNSVVVMKGVNIGDGSVIGMESMVTKDIPRNCVAVGTPAKVIRSGINWVR